MAESGVVSGAADAQDGYVHTAFDAVSGRGPATDRIVIDTLLAAARRPRTVGAQTPATRFVIYTSGVWVLGRASEPAERRGAHQSDRPGAWRVPSRRTRARRGAPRHLRTMVVRPGVVYGGGAGIMGDVFKQASNGLVRVVGDGNNHWPLVYDRDLADLYRPPRADVKTPRASTTPTTKATSG